MSLCKYGCGEEITWIDGRPYSLQSHFTVCRPGEKKVKPAVHVGQKSIAPEAEQASLDAEVETAMQQRADVNGSKDGTATVGVG